MSHSPPASDKGSVLLTGKMWQPAMDSIPALPVSALENKARLDANKAPGVQENYQRKNLKDGILVKILVVTQKRSQLNPAYANKKLS